MTITLEQIEEFFKTDAGKSAQKQIITNYIQNDPGGKELLDGIMKPEIDSAVNKAVQDWETTGKGKALRDKNQELLSKIAEGKGVSDELKKFKDLIDIGKFTDYNGLRDAVLSIDPNNAKPDDQVLELKKQMQDQTIIPYWATI